MDKQVCPICQGSGIIGIYKPGVIEDWACWLCESGLIDSSRFSTYEGLTEIIKRISEFRKKYGTSWIFREERDQPLVKAKNLDIQNYPAGEQPYIQNRLECCDCGLTHGLYIDKKGFLRTIPWRPESHKYA